MYPLKRIKKKFTNELYKNDSRGGQLLTVRKHE